jgi:hypothetical protein
VRSSDKQKATTSESPEASVKIRHGEFARPHHTRAAVGSTAVGALLPGLLPLVRVRKEGQRSGRVARTIDEGYGRVARRREETGYWGRAVHIRLVRFGRRQVRDEGRQARDRCDSSSGSGVGLLGLGLSMSLSLSLSLLRARKGMRVERGALRSSVCGSVFLRGEAFAGGRGVGALVARGEGAHVREHDDRRAVVYGGGVRQVRLAEAGRGGEVHAGAVDGRGEGKGERAAAAVRRRRRRGGWVGVIAVFETWAQGVSRHSRLGVGDGATIRQESPWTRLGDFCEGFMNGVR